MTDRIALLQAWLALEHEAVWLYGVIGGRVDSVDDDAHTSWDRHRNVRDRLIGLIRAAGGAPAAPAMGYAPTRINSESDGRRAAQSIERRLANACLATLASDADRARAVKGLTSSAQAAAQWGARPEAFPGLT